MGKLFFASALFLFVGVFSQNSYGCLCAISDAVEKDPQNVEQSVRKFYLNSFKGAVFTGKVLNVEQVKVKIDEDNTISKRKVTIQVEKYWLGVKEATMTIYTGIGGGDCGVNFQVGARYFFYPQYFQGGLEAFICDYPSKEDMDADGKSVKFFNKIFGKPKTFKNKSNQ